MSFVTFNGIIVRKLLITMAKPRCRSFEKDTELKNAELELYNTDQRV